MSKMLLIGGKDTNGNAKMLGLTDEGELKIKGIEFTVSPELMNLVLKEGHQFADEAERDSYFDSNPNEKVKGVFVNVGEGFQVWQGEQWQDVTAVVRGPQGPEGQVSQEDFNEHLADDVTQGKVHGLIYESGSFTAKYEPEFGEFGTTHESTGKYVRINNMVFVRFDLMGNNLDLGTASGELRITGLPFVPKYNAAAAVGLVRGFNFATEPSHLRLVFNTNNFIRFYVNSYNDIQTRYMPVDALAEGGVIKNQIIISGSYLIS